MRTNGRWRTKPRARERLLQRRLVRRDVDEDRARRRHRARARRGPSAVASSLATSGPIWVARRPARVMTKPLPSSASQARVVASAGERAEQGRAADAADRVVERDQRRHRLRIAEIDAEVRDRTIGRGQLGLPALEARSRRRSRCGDRPRRRPASRRAPARDPTGRASRRTSRTRREAQPRWRCSPSTSTIAIQPTPPSYGSAAALASSRPSTSRMPSTSPAAMKNAQSSARLIPARCVRERQPAGDVGPAEAADRQRFRSCHRGPRTWSAWRSSRRPP